MARLEWFERRTISPLTANSPHVLSAFESINCVSRGLSGLSF
jgi:hypothetical protein